jgi:hypothetical protein
MTSLGSPLYKIEYTHTDDNLPITTTETWSLKGNEVFMLLANVGTFESSTYMPIFQKMINSFNSSDLISQSMSERLYEDKDQFSRSNYGCLYIYMIFDKRLLRCPMILCQ